MKVGILLCLTPVPSLNLILAQRQLVKGWGCSSVGCEALSSWMLSHMRVITAAPQRLSCVNPNYWYCDCLPKKKHLFTGRLTRMIAIGSIHYNWGILFSANNACSGAVGRERPWLQWEVAVCHVCSRSSPPVFDVAGILTAGPGIHHYEHLHVVMRQTWTPLPYLLPPLYLALP